MSANFKKIQKTLILTSSIHICYLFCDILEGKAITGHQNCRIKGNCLGKITHFCKYLCNGATVSFVWRYYILLAFFTPTSPVRKGFLLLLMVLYPMVNKTDVLMT